jgi:hypothetical protein
LWTFFRRFASKSFIRTNCFQNWAHPGLDAEGILLATRRTAAATWAGVTEPNVRGGATPPRANIPSPRTKPGQTADADTPLPASSMRSALVHSISAAFVAP